MTLDLTLEFAHFNLVIRLSKVKQLSLFPFSPVGRPCVETTGRCSGLLPFILSVESVKQLPAALGTHRFPVIFKGTA